MFINSVLSFLGCWDRLNKLNRPELDDLARAIEPIKVLRSTFRSIQQHGSNGLARFDWQTDVRLVFGTAPGRRISSLNAAKNGVGVEFQFGKFAFAESDIFVKLPLFVQAGKINCGVVVVLMKRATQTMPLGVSSFEMIRDRLMELRPLPLRYPFAVVGISDSKTNLTLEEMTLAFDQFLIDEIGHSMYELRSIGETTNCEFKEKVPESKKVAQEVCALANLKHGGVILFGIDDRGMLRGIQKTDLDGIQLALSNIVTSSCSPTPVVQLRAFDFPDDPEKCVLAMKVHEIKHKPCMVDHRVYIRVGASSRPAGPEDIRRLLYGE